MRWWRPISPSPGNTEARGFRLRVAWATNLGRTLSQKQKLKKKKKKDKNQMCVVPQEVGSRLRTSKVIPRLPRPTGSSFPRTPVASNS